MKTLLTIVFLLVSCPVFAVQSTADLQSQLAQLQAQQAQLQKEQAILQENDNQYQDSLVQQRYQQEMDRIKNLRNNQADRSDDGVYTNLPYNQNN